ncbi:hypothetical protein ABZX28_07015 [Streptomyces rubiginosohelvolus]|uniref:hypothetical protein n=1 Tax=Streptomyces rubiginosohelvolus TaxID=67362 RepID=UPI0033B84AA5
MMSAVGVRGRPTPTHLIGRRTRGPLFLTNCKAPAGKPTLDVCPETCRARLSWRLTRVERTRAGEGGSGGARRRQRGLSDDSLPNGFRSRCPGGILAVRWESLVPGWSEKSLDEPLPQLLVGETLHRAPRGIRDLIGLQFADVGDGTEQEPEVEVLVGGLVLGRVGVDGVDVDVQRDLALRGDDVWRDAGLACDGRGQCRWSVCAQSLRKASVN